VGQPLRRNESVTDVDLGKLERRVLVLAPTGKDASLTRVVLGHVGIKCEICANLGQVVRELERGAGALLLAEEAIAYASESLAGIIARQPPWSDLPILVLARHGVDSEALAASVDALGNVIVLERPIRVAALASAVGSALRARDRQYHARAHLLELDNAVRALEEVDRRKDEFLATLAHELRNPLAPIHNALHLLRLTAANEASPYLLDMMERQVGYLVRLVDDLLEVSRITRGKIELRKERVELSSIVEAAVETTRPLIESARHELSIALTQEPLFLEADRVRLAQVFSNLLNNAAKYTNEGGRIWITAARDNDDAIVTVRDSGVGIPAASLPRVFDMFMQGDAPKSRGGGGLGIGLTLVRTLTEMHGGTVEARSKGPGKGSEFVVRLPLAADSRAVLPELTRGPLRAVQGPTRVLVVDDSRDGADSLRALLELLGAEVRVAYDGPTALVAVSAFQPEVVLLDIGMPGMDGFEVARRIRLHPKSRKVTLIALTGWGQEKDRRDSEAAGFDHHLIKPVDMHALQGLLAAVHEVSKQQERSREGAESG
jgi:signal transduction histidine kinase/ActR/RegA family two-component response regulator